MSILFMFTLYFIIFHMKLIDESSLSDQDDKDVDEGTIVASKKSI